MKTTVALLFLFSSPAFAQTAMYEVPVPAELQPYAKHPLEEFSVQVTDGEMEIHYVLPLVLTGVKNEMHFKGKILGDGQYPTQLSSENGSMICENRESVKTCNVLYKNIKVDLEQVEARLEKMDLTPDEKIGIFDVASRFGGDQGGIITYQNEEIK